MGAITSPTYHSSAFLCTVMRMCKSAISGSGNDIHTWTVSFAVSYDEGVRRLSLETVSPINFSVLAVVERRQLAFASRLGDGMDASHLL